MYLKKKRGQITIFMIIGILLLLILLLVLFMRSKEIQIDDVVVVPPALLPVKNYIDFCKDQATIDALDLVGRQAGFVELRTEARIAPDRRLTFGSGIDPVPYWYYDNANWVPTIEYMEYEMSEYINERFVSCIDEMDFLTNGFKFKKLKEKPVTTLSINEKDISVEIVFPVEISTLDDQISIRIQRFYKVYDVKLIDMMDLAKYILDYENTFYFLENITINLMSINKNIPLTGMELQCKVSTWNIYNIKFELQDMLFGSLNNIRVQDTDYYPFEANMELYEQYRNYASSLKEAYESVTLVDNFEEPEDYENALFAAASSVRMPTQQLPSDAYYYFHFYMPMIQANSKRYENFSVDFLYIPEFGMDIQAKPSNEGVLKSNMVEGAKKYLSFFCINIYHFTYDITYPVLITLNDPDALNGRGYSFRFAFPVIIRNNEGLRYKQHMDFTPSLPKIDDYCHDGSGRRAIVRAYDLTQGSTIPLTDVNISMICVNKKCPLGTTARVGADAVLRINLTDACSNPYIEATKEGYFRGIYPVEDWETRIDVEMIQLKNYTVDLRRHRLNLVDNSLGSAEPVSLGEVIISISGVLANGELYDDYFVVIPGQRNEIQLPVIDAEYELSIIYMRDSEDFSGGYFINWNLDKDQLRDGNNIRFHFIEIITPTLDDAAAIAIGSLYEIESEALGPFIN
jgi:hypothetical protein